MVSSRRSSSSTRFVRFIHIRYHHAPALLKLLGHERRLLAETARLGGVTVRALHHYESIGLLTPSERSATGYRLYAAADLDRLGLLDSI